MPTHAQRFLHSEGGYHPTITRNMLPIRQSILATRGLRAEPKEVLIKICELFEKGKRKQCDATNSWIAKELGMSPKNVSRLISGLVANGWVTNVILAAQGNRRLLVPTDKARACYSPESEDTLSSLSAISEDTHLASEDTPEVGIATPRSEDRVSPQVGIGSPQKWGDLSIREYNREFNTEDNSLSREVASLRASLAERELELVQVKIQRDELAEQVAELKTSQAESKKQPTKSTGGRAAAPAAEPSDFEAFWDAFDKKEDRHKCTLKWKALDEADRAAALAHAPLYAKATPEKRYRKNPLTYLNGRC